MSGGYVYVIEFDNGMIKVGHSQAIAQRLQTHKQIARSFGLTVERCWESPCHEGWRRNEDALKRLARELGGTPTTPEYFNGVAFDALVEKARELPFPSPEPAPEPALARVPAVAEEGAPQAAGFNDRIIRLAVLQENARRESLTTQAACVFIDLGATPEFMRKRLGRESLNGDPAGEKLADRMEIILRTEESIRRQLGAPPVPFRPFCGEELPA